MNKVYLGDSVYVQQDEHGELVLTTENCYPDDPRNRIVLETQTIINLLIYLKGAGITARLN